MSVQVVYKNSNKIANSKVHAVFTDENFNIDRKNSLSKSDTLIVKKLVNIKKNNLKKITHFSLSNGKTFILVAIKKNLKTNDFENLGAEFYEYIKDNSLKKISISNDHLNLDNFIHFIHGFKIKTYEFNLYKTSKKKKCNIFTSFN